MKVCIKQGIKIIEISFSEEELNELGKLISSEKKTLKISQSIDIAKKRMKDFEER